MIEYPTSPRPRLAPPPPLWQRSLAGRAALQRALQPGHGPRHRLATWARWVGCLALSGCALPDAPPAPPSSAQGAHRLAHRPVVAATPAADPASVPWDQSNNLVARLGGHSGHARAPAASAAAAAATHGPAGPAKGAAP